MNLALLLCSGRREVLKVFTAGLASVLFPGAKSVAGRPATPKPFAPMQTGNGTSIGPDTFEAFRYQSSGYRYAVIPSNRYVPSGFEREDFDDSRFAVGAAAFGSGGQ